MGTLYVGIDFFYPGRYRPQIPVSGAETYQHEDNVAYVILQPVVTTDEATDPILPPTYFALSASDLGTTHQVTYIASHATRDAIAATAVPVPFPPLSELRLDLVWDAHLEPVTIERQIPTRRTLGQPVDSPLLLAVNLWPEFAFANFARPPIDQYDDLKPVARSDVLSWGVSLVPRILKRAREFPDTDPDPLTAPETDAHALLRDLETALANPDVPVSEAEIRAYLEAPASGVSRIAALWTRLLAADAATGKHAILPPRFLHDQDTLSVDPVRLLHLGDGSAEPPIAVSYHNQLWRDLGGRARSSDHDFAQSAVDALRRLFGFGERLRWPRPPQNDAFMVADPKATRVTSYDAIGTNAHSLLGQVFRIPLNIGSGARPKSLTVQVQHATSIDLAQPMSILLDRIEADPDGTFGVTLARDADRPNGFFVYLPKMAEATAAAGPDATQAYYSLPHALLDAVDRNARWSSPVGANELIVRSAPRIGLRESELYRSEILGAADTARRLCCKVRVYPLAVSSSTIPLFKIAFDTSMHADEAAELVQRFKGLDTTNAELWVTLAKSAGGGVRAWPLAGRVLDFEEDLQSGPFTVVADLADQVPSLRQLLSKAVHPDGGSTGAEDSDAGYFADILFGDTAMPDPLFNLLVRPASSTAPPPLCILNSSFTSRVSTSTDRLLERFELSLSPSPFPQADDQPLLDHLANFNKLRIALSSADPAITQRSDDHSGENTDGRVVTFLTYPDAAIPLHQDGYSAAAAPWLAASPPGSSSRHFGYFVSQIFTQDARADEAVSDAERNRAESLRYINYLTPEVAWRIEGYAEHQYTFRLPFSGPDVHLRLATDIDNPGTAAKADASGDGAVALVHWSFVDAGSIVRLTFPRDFLKFALTADSASSPRPARLRTIYQPLADLIAAIDHGAASLELERWVFDADLPATLTAAEPTSAIRANLRRAARYTYTLDPATPELQPLADLRRLLGLPLSALEQALDQLARAAGDDWLEIDIPFGSAWIATGDPLFGTVTECSDVLRLGLRLDRPANSVVAPDVLTPNLDDAQGFGLPVDTDRVNRYPMLKNESFASLKVRAASELADYLSITAPSPLRTSFAWVRAVAGPSPAQPVGANPADPEDVYDPNRLRRLFGELTPYLLIPRGERPPAQRVVDLFYVPVAFRPLREHAQLGDPATTLEFAEFLLQLLDDLCSGRDTLLVPISPTSQKDAYLVGKRLRTELLPIVVKQLSALITHVHNDEDAASSADPLFSYVDGLAKRLITAANGAITACGELMTATPGLFATAKAFGLGIFEPDAWTDRLYAIQVSKDIRSGDDPLSASSQAPRDDRDQFSFDRFRVLNTDRYFVDVLDDGRYDNEFQIAESQFDPHRVAWQGNKPGPVLRDPQKLMRRGGTQARSGEDAIEQRNRFDDPQDPQRQVEADVVHWNPSWRTRPDSSGRQKRFYLLPSRRYPATPTVLKPKTLGGDDPPWRCWLHLALANPLEKPNLGAKIAERLRQVLDEQSTVSFPGMGGEELIASRVAEGGPVFAVADARNTRGWWHVESYGTAHYFLIEPDEELNEDDVILANDRFAIEVELHERPPTIDAVETPAIPKPTDAVSRSFQYWKQLRAHTASAAPAPATLATVESELRGWLLPPAGQSTCPLLQPYEAPVDPQPSQGIERTLSRFIHHPGRLDEVVSTPEPFSIGSVLAAEILELRNSSREKLPRYVLRVIVLDEPWRYTRVRVRIERNFRSVNGDDLPDINKAFQMVGKFSPWSGHGREPAVVDFTSMVGRNLPDQLVRMQPVGVTAEDFDDLPLAASVNYGDLLGLALAATFFDSNDVSQSFWNLDRTRSTTIVVGGMIMQLRPDLHPRFGSQDTSEQLSARTEYIPRQHLPQVAAAAPSALMNTINKRQVPTLHQQARIAWSNENGERILICTWPIIFSRK